MQCSCGSSIDTDDENRIGCSDCGRVPGWGDYDELHDEARYDDRLRKSRAYAMDLPCLVERSPGLDQALLAGIGKPIMLLRGNRIVSEILHRVTIAANGYKITAGRAIDVGIFGFTVDEVLDRLKQDFEQRKSEADEPSL